MSLTIILLLTCLFVFYIINCIIWFFTAIHCFKLEDLTPYEVFLEDILSEEMPILYWLIYFLNIPVWVLASIYWYLFIRKGDNNE